MHETAVGVQHGELATGRGEEPGSHPSEMLDPRAAETGRGGVLAGGGIPEFDASVLSAGGKD